MEEGRKPFCIHASAFLRVLGVLKANTAVWKNGHENKTEGLGGEEL